MYKLEYVDEIMKNQRTKKLLMKKFNYASGAYVKINGLTNEKVAALHRDYPDLRPIYKTG